MNKLKHKILVSAAVALTSAVLIACGSTSEQDRPPPEQPPQASQPAAAASESSNAQDKPTDAAMSEQPTEAMADHAMAATEAPAAPATEAPTAAAPVAAATNAPAMTAPSSDPAPTAMQAEPTAASSSGNPPPPPNPPVMNTVEPEPAATEAPQVEEGSKVGQMPPAYAMTLADGSTVESTNIVATGRPVFMVYFATW